MRVLDEWVIEVTDALGLDASLVDEDLILDVARVVAHEVERKAAPVTTFLIGLAAGRAGGDSPAIDEAARTIVALAGSKGRGGAR